MLAKNQTPDCSLTPAREVWVFVPTHLGPVMIVGGEAYGRLVDERGRLLSCETCRCSVARIVEEQRGTLTRFCADCDDEVVGYVDERGDRQALRAAIASSMFSHGPCGTRGSCSCLTCINAATNWWMVRS